MVSIRFEDPPEPTAPPVVLEPSDLVKNRDRDQIIAALPDHPGQWAVVSRHRSRPAAAKIARLLRARHPHLEFRCAGLAGEGVVYGRCPSRA